MKRAPRVIVITGFMAAGKTTIARALAHRLSATFIDLDDFISERYGGTPQAIIDEEGEPHFRLIETRALADVLREAAPRAVAPQAWTDAETSQTKAGETLGGRFAVVALGGGTWAFAANRALIDAHDCLSVWLDAPFELCWQRIKAETDDARSRPLARTRERAQRLYEERRTAYALARRRVRVEAEKTADEIAAEIVSFINSETN